MINKEYVFMQGMLAASQGWERNSPYLSNPSKDWWLAGYDSWVA
jgi:hypothetical protein